jgi:tetratricopeptide (TPR) repeat protein
MTTGTTLQQAITLHQAGQLEDAEQLYRNILQIEPDHPNANYNLGLLMIQQNQIDDALALFTIALNANPNSTQYWVNYIEALIYTEHFDIAENILKQGRLNGLEGKAFDQLDIVLVSAIEKSQSTVIQTEINVVTNQITAKPIKTDRLIGHAKKGKNEEVRKLYKMFLDVYPKSQYTKKGHEVLQNNNVNKKVQSRIPQTQIDYVISLYSAGQFQNTLSVIAALSKVYPNVSLLFSISGACHQSLGQLHMAVMHYERALTIEPELVEAHSNLGIALKELGQLNDAINCYEKALKIKPDYAPAHYNLGIAFDELGQLDAAVNCYKQALTIKPNYAEAHNNLGFVLKELDQLDESCKSCKQALMINPNYVEAHNNLGNALHDLGQLNEAVKCYKKALEIKPDYAEAHNNLGIVFKDLGQRDAAFKHYNRSLEISPDYAEARHNLSLLQLDNGYLSEGFKNYEARWKCKNVNFNRYQCGLTQWAGEPLKGKNILIWGEQGVGDEIQFSTLIPEFRTLGGNIVIKCAPKLVDLFQYSFPWAKVRKSDTTNSQERMIDSEFDYQIPMGSLAPLFRKTIDDFHKKQKPFIPRLTQKEKKIRTELNLRKGQLLIGLCWRSSLATIKRTRTIGYLDIKDLLPFQLIQGAQFLAVQYDECQSELNRVRSKGLPIHYNETVDQENDLLNTSALLGACDLVISASTAVYQLSASLGVPTLCFKVLNCEYQRIPWHPTVQYLNLNSNKPSLLIQEIITKLPEYIRWSNEVTTSERRIHSY